MDSLFRSKSVTSIMPMRDYDTLEQREIDGIRAQIDEGMRTINGDTAPVEITARQAEILVKAYELVRVVHPNWDAYQSYQISPEQMEELLEIVRRV